MFRFYKIWPSPEESVWKTTVFLDRNEQDQGIREYLEEQDGPHSGPNILPAGCALSQGRPQVRHTQLPAAHHQASPHDTAAHKVIVKVHE